jgi:hypothetical protein
MLKCRWRKSFQSNNLFHLSVEKECAATSVCNVRVQAVKGQSRNSFASCLTTTCVCDVRISGKSDESVTDVYRLLLLYREKCITPADARHNANTNEETGRSKAAISSVSLVR